MLTGNGRHRRPRQAPALLVAAGVTGSAIAIPLLGAASANAADGTTWDKVAQCESGGSWSADNGNGYYGGLQISQDDWNAYGGSEYAYSADQASRSQQIAVAEKILADRGTTPWATCALLSGLTSNSGSVNVDTGLGDSDAQGSDAQGSDAQGSDSKGSDAQGSDHSSQSKHSSDSGDSSDSSDLPDSSPSSPSSDSSSGAHAKPSPSTGKQAGSHGSGKTDETPKSDKSSSSGSQGEQGGDSPTADPAGEDPDNSGQIDGSWSLVDTGALSSGGRHRGGSADESATDGRSDASLGRHASRDASTYTVREGDTLVSIADSLDVDGGWCGLYAANKKAIGADPNDITPGQTLNIGAEKGGK
ncbi:transglycosylase family protein [Streptomyces sp. NPDC048045]|uniref:LysM peptidoglycan-binding domain-containing protein n=1 Tax=Streptomyces sp. NPDC048045 TaxID=3154710 RepID=UPI00343EFCB0